VNAGSIETSERLKKTLLVLKMAEGGPHVTTLGIEQATNSRAVHSDIAALRANGYVIEGRYLPGTGRVFGYRLIGYDPAKNVVGARPQPIEASAA
jgi:hypothetical protein